MDLPGSSQRRAVIAGLVALIFLLLCSFQVGFADTESQVAAVHFAPQLQEISNLDQDFQTIYQKARVESLRASGPVILVEDGKAALIKGEAQSESSYIAAPKYDILKTTDHVPLAIFVLLDSYAKSSGQLSSSAISDLEQLNKLAAKAYATLPNYNLTPDQLQRQKKIFNSSFQFMATVFKSGKVEKAKLISFTRSMTPYMMQNAYDAIAIELGGLNQIVMFWKKEMTKGQWRSLHVVVVDGHMARKQNRTVQYFCKLLGEPDEGRRIVYFEFQHLKDPVLDLLGTHLLDKRIAEAFFNDPTRMHRDLLSDAARLYLQEHPVQITPGSKGTDH